MSNLIEQHGRPYDVKTLLNEKDIQGGDPISDSIRSSIERCDEFLVLLSKYSTDRQWVLVEVGALRGHYGNT
jgi:hypothetical protein